MGGRLVGWRGIWGVMGALAGEVKGGGGGECGLVGG